MAETGVALVVNHIEVHPYFPQQDALDYHRSTGSSCRSGARSATATTCSNTPSSGRSRLPTVSALAQTILAWHVARQVIPLPKAASRMQVENLDVFDIKLTDAEVEAITALGRPDGRLADQDPAVYEEF